MLHERGFTLFYAVLAASLLLAIGLAIFNITYKELILSAGARESATAFYAADAGLECALYWDLKHIGISSPAFGFYGDSLASGLVGYWRFEEGEGDEAFDSSGRGNNGELTSMDSGVAWISGTIGDGALTFDGMDDYVSIDDDASLDFESNEDFSISLWFRSTENVGMIFSMRDSTDGNPVIDIGVGAVSSTINNGRIKALVRDDDGGSYALVNGAVANNGAWRHVVITRTSGGRLELFLDTVSQGSNASAGADGPITTDSRAIGSERRWVQDNYGTADMRYLLGSVDDVRVYGRELSSTEITTIYQDGSNLQFVPPVAEDSDVMCAGVDITEVGNGWNPETSPTSATSSFDILFPSSRCAIVDVFKDTSTTTIVSRGYNTCDEDNPRRVERAIRAIY